MHVPLLVKRFFIRPYRWRWWKSPPNIHFICFKYFCVFVIFSLFRPFFYKSSQTFSIKICSKYLYDATPNNTLWKMWCTDIDSMFSCFECIIYYLIFFKNNIMFHGNNLATPTPKKIRQSKALFLVFMCISSVVW